jgi:hypothetical protein
MGFLDALTANSFKKDASGQTVFYPWGLFGKGYILPDLETENKARTFFIRFHTVCLISFLPAIVLYVSIGWIYIFVLVPILAWYYFGSRVLIAQCSVSDRKLTLKEAFLTGPTKLLGTKTLWMLLIVSILFAAHGLSMVLRGWFIGALGCLVFGLWAAMLGYMIKEKCSRSRKE